MQKFLSYVGAVVGAVGLVGGAVGADGDGVGAADQLVGLRDGTVDGYALRTNEDGPYCDTHAPTSANSDSAQTAAANHARAPLRRSYHGPIQSGSLPRARAPVHVPARRSRPARHAETAAKKPRPFVPTRNQGLEQPMPPSG